jgi:hypothetical protein
MLQVFEYGGSPWSNMSVKRFSGEPEATSMGEAQKDQTFGR